MIVSEPKGGRVSSELVGDFRTDHFCQPSEVADRLRHAGDGHKTYSQSPESTSWRAMRPRTGAPASDRCHRCQQAASAERTTGPRDRNHPHRTPAAHGAAMARGWASDVIHSVAARLWPFKSSGSRKRMRTSEVEDGVATAPKRQSVTAGCAHARALPSCECRHCAAHHSPAGTGAPADARAPGARARGMRRFARAGRSVRRPAAPCSTRTRRPCQARARSLTRRHHRHRRSP